jgi:hypothetical protein
MPQQFESMIARVEVGGVYPVWWDTEDGRPAGKHFATILDIRPYTKMFSDIYTHILKLSAPSTKRGWLEMSV